MKKNTLRNLRFKVIGSLSIILLSSVALSACSLSTLSSNAAAETEAAAGTLTVRIVDESPAMENARTIVPDFAGMTTKYHITIKNYYSDNIVKETDVLLGAIATPIAFTGLAPATYNVIVSAMAGYTTFLRSGSTLYTLSPGTTGNVAVSIGYPNQGLYGDLELTVEWPAASGATVVEATVVDTSSDNGHILGLSNNTLADGVYSAKLSHSGMVSGVHTITVKFYTDSTKTVCKGVFIEQANIFNNFKSDKWIDQDGNLKDRRTFTIDEFTSSATSVNLALIDESGTTREYTLTPSAKTIELGFVTYTKLSIVPCLSVTGQTFVYGLNTATTTPTPANVPFSVTLIPKNNTIYIKVTSPDGNTANLYQIHANKLDMTILPTPIVTLISDEAGLTNLGALAEPFYIQLTSDITVTNWTPKSITNAGSIFDGGGHTITIDSYVADPLATANGLFGTNEGTIQNVKVKAKIITTGHPADGMIAGINRGTIYRCSSSGSISSQGNDFGEATWTGGLVGDNYPGGTIEECFSTATLQSLSTECYLGGIAGNLGNGGIIKNCYSRCQITGANGNSNCGGLVGDCATSGTFTNSYSASSLTGDTVYGLSPPPTTPLVTACYYDSEKITGTPTPGLQPENNKTTLEMQTKTTYATSWDFDNVWGIDPTKNINGGYPYLRALAPPSDIKIPAGTIASVTLQTLMNDNLDGNFTLLGNITLSGAWTPIGTSSAPFTGTFDGGGKTINGLTIDNTTSGYKEVGMFADVGSSATIKNLHLTGINVLGGASSYQTGGLAAINEGTIYRCSSSGNVTFGSDTSTGGLIGLNSITGTVSECWSSAAVTASLYSGGLVGANDGTISNCYARGVVTVVWGGGLVGSNNDTGTIKNSYAAGSVFPNGGDASERNGFGYLQGLVGNQSINVPRGTITNGYFDLSKIATTYYAGNVITSGYFGTAKSTGEMQDSANTATNYSGWDFATVWVIDPTKNINGGYPYLKQNTP